MRLPPEVLLEAIAAPTVGPGCELTGGRWYSYYDGQTWIDKSDVDSDHLVPLAEAWGSGAWAWTMQQRQAFANDLDDGRFLAAVTDNVNSSKGVAKELQQPSKNAERPARVR